MCGTTQQILNNINHQYIIFMATVLSHNVKIARVGQHSNFSATTANKQTPARGCFESFQPTFFHITTQLIICHFSKSTRTCIS